MDVRHRFAVGHEVHLARHGHGAAREARKLDGRSAGGSHLVSGIDAARAVIEEARRAEIYAKALDLVMELAVEMPTYQRNDLTVYNNTKIDSSTLNQNPTAFDGIFSKIWEVGYVD